jgi:transporter family-2 protein
VGLTVTAALSMSLRIDHLGWFRMAYHPVKLGRALGGLLLVGGVTLIAKF